MSGGHLEQYRKLFRLNLLLILILEGIIVLAISYFLFQFTDINEQIALGIIAVVTIMTAVAGAFWMTAVLAKPTEFLAQAIFHISPNQHLVAAPDVEKLNFGRELVATLTRQMYDMASTHKALTVEKPQTGATAGLIDFLPVCVIGIDNRGNVVVINKTFKNIFKIDKISDQPIENMLKMKFNGETVADWQKQVKTQSINATKTWTRVEISATNEPDKSYYDISASYSQKNITGIEIILVLFPRTEEFQMEENAVDLLSMSVHEIRTPLTILRGYIEALRQELQGKVDPETQEYINRISTSSENLASYMANILNVAKAEQNQLKLDLRPASWSATLKEILNSIELRAKVRGKELKVNIAPNLPEVAVDVVSINEVITNLIENSIKYSPKEAVNIYVDVTTDKDGSVLTTVRDEGVGIPDSVVKNLFTKFYRDHHNRDHVAGTGLGLYISKEIVNAHHGNIWITSREGQGTTVGFTLIPASKLDEITKNPDNGFEKVGRGWIKNHNMQRR